MSGRYRLVDFLGFTPVSHRPPLPKRWWVYCGVAFLAPSLVLQLVPATEVPYRDLVWLLTLVPAYLLSLHYGLRGAVAGLAMGTVLFTSIQFLVALNLEPEDWRITVPIYVSYGVIAISVGWLSEQLHLFYARAIQGERVGDRQDPRPHDLPRHTPPHRRQPLGRAHAGDRARDGVGGADGNAEVGGEEQRDRAARLRAEAAERGQLGDPLAHRPDDAPPPRHGAEPDRRVRREDHPDGDVVGVGQVERLNRESDEQRRARGQEGDDD